MASDPTEVVDAQPLAKVEAQPLATQGVVTTEAGALLSQGIAAGLDQAALADLIRLFNTQEDRAAAKEFAAALADFQAKCPPITKRSSAEIVTQSGTRFSYTYAELDEIARTVQPFLHDLGLSYTWDSRLENHTLTCICTLRHLNGHSITASFTASTETKAGMSEAQKTAAGLTFSRRQSLVQVLGLTTADPDNDGAGPPGPVGPITEEQCRELNDLLIVAAEAFGFTADKEKQAFLDDAAVQTGVSIKTLADIPVNYYDAAVRAVTSRLGGPKE